MDQDVERFVKTCHGCQLASGSSNPEPMTPTPLPAGPWQDVAIDLMGPLPSGEFILVCVDYYSRYYEIYIIKTITSEKIIDCLEKMFIIHGLPVTITSDNGRQFVSDEFEKYLFENNIEHRRTTPLHPSANGEVERQNRTLLKRIKIANAEGKNWKIEIRKFLLAYRTTPHSTTGVPPSELMFNRKIRTKLPEIQFSLNDGEVRDRDMFRKEKITRVRNSTHVKEFREPEVETSEVTNDDPPALSLPHGDADAFTDVPSTLSDTLPTRPQRDRRVPVKFKDYDMG
ncbi:uncharacterized protein K02A2.6-like [Mya arenaria]|uniref:uncharacterized protein K02A2.6-like n=1 Tax=Mya arenaria TaxID=6604 RepID=UPI0022E18457|nr:uncharacterized protein K02A2.6-like [Mya arenaria]